MVTSGDALNRISGNSAFNQSSSSGLIADKAATGSHEASCGGSHNLPPQWVEPRSLPASGEGDVVFEFHDPAAGRPLPMKIFAYFPEPAKCGEPTKVLFVMHGVNRDAEAEFRRNIPLDRAKHNLRPEKHNFVLLVPEFSEELFPSRNNYNFGGIFQPLCEICGCYTAQSSDLTEHMQDENAEHAKAREVWAFTAIERMYSAIKTAAHLNTSGFSIFGHSAGAQFVHRYVAFVRSSLGKCEGEASHLEHAVAANAGSYTCPTFEENFPFGFGGLEGKFARQDMLTFLTAPLTVLLGDKDTDPQHKHLPKDKAAMRQGPHRFARGHHFFHSAQAQAAALGVHFGWNLEIVPNVGHQGAEMLRSHLQRLFPTTTPLSPKVTSLSPCETGLSPLETERRQDSTAVPGETLPPQRSVGV